jgi:2-octaprenyl-6-methoxyphenol hydroxylase
MREDTDILICGGGIAGLTAAVVLARQGWRVICADPMPGPRDDQRTTAILRPGQALLDQAGLWDRLAPLATPLRVMRITDASGPPVSRDFDAADLGDGPFGWNLPNAALHATLTAALPPGTLRAAAFDQMLVRDDAALVRLSDGTRLAARLVIGADGRHSAVRQAAGIGARTIRYGQKALVFTVTHGAPHDNISTEVHRTGGPFTLVPLPDGADGGPRSSVVWMDSADHVDHLAALTDADFSAAATERSAEVLGPLTITGPRQVWPIIAQHAHRLTAARSLLMAEAAHVLPPIGAQGLNLSLKDLSVLAGLLIPGGDPGAPGILSAYARARAPDLALRLTGIGLLNRASMAGAAPLTALRARAMTALHDIPPVRRALMRLGLG